MQNPVLYTFFNNDTQYYLSADLCTVNQLVYKIPIKIQVSIIITDNCSCSTCSPKRHKPKRNEIQLCLQDDALKDMNEFQISELLK